MTGRRRPARAGAPAPAILRIAHRGASARAPENTRAAFEEAIRIGTDAVEFDVHLSRDGVPVVIHDDTVDRTTNGRGAVASLTAAALRRLDAGSWFGRRFRGERIPSLEETLALLSGRSGANIEIKAPAAVEAVARAVGRTAFAGWLVVSSFDPAVLCRARAAMPRTRLGFLASRSARRLPALHRRLDLHAFHLHHRIADRRRIRGAQARGLEVYVWPVNDPALLRRLLARGADGIMTDDPGLFADLPGAHR